MPTSTKLPDNDPRVIAWEEFKSSPEYAEASRWANGPGGDGALWQAFLAGFSAQPIAA